MWEKSALEVQNRRLREEHPEGSQLLDVEEQLALSKGEVERLMEQLAEIPHLEQQLRDALQEAERLRVLATASISAGDGGHGAEVKRLTRELTQAMQAAEEAGNRAAESEERATENAMLL